MKASDLFIKCLEEASRYLSDLDGDLIELLKGNAEELPFDNNSVQGITCVYIYFMNYPELSEKKF